MKILLMALIALGLFVIFYWLVNRKGKLGSILIDPTDWRTCLETYHKSRKIRYYINGRRVSEKTHDQEMKAIWRRMRERDNVSVK